MKKKKIIVIFLLMLVCIAFFKPSIASVSASGETDVQTNINSSIYNIINDLDFSKLNEIFSNLGDKFNVFGNGNFKDKVDAIIKGEYFSDYDSLFSAIVSLVFDGLISFLPLFLTIIAIVVLSVMVTSFKTNNNSGGVTDIIHFVCYAVIIILIVSVFTSIMATTYQVLTTIQSLMEAVFPMLLTLLTGIGAVSSVAMYKPMIAILSGGITLIFNNILYPMFIISFVFTLISNLSTTVKLNKFNDFINSSFKWITGFILTIFSSFMVIQGISAGRFDSVSIKATKFAVKSYIPIIGGFISEGFNFILLSGILVKNAIGLGVLILLFITIIAPIIQIIVFKLGLQLLSAIIEPIGNSRITNFISSCAKILIYPLAIIVGVSFMFLLTVVLIMTTANVF